MLPSRVGGDTPDPHGAGPHAPGFMTKGIENPKTCYYRRVSLTRYAHLGWCGAFQTSMPRALRYKESSQGGGITLAAGGLANDLVAVMPDVRSPCHFRRAADICDEPPYTEITRYLAIHRDLGDTAFTTVSYFDGVNFAERASAPALASVGLWTRSARRRRSMPRITRMAGQKDIVVYPFNDHGWTSCVAAFDRPDRGYQNLLIPERWMEAMWPNVRFAETTTTRHLSSGPRMARSTHLTASSAPFTSSLHDVSTVAARSSGTAKKSTGTCSAAPIAPGMRQLETAFATEAPAKIAVFDC
jgi:hypothetical protein